MILFSFVSPLNGQNKDGTKVITISNKGVRDCVFTDSLIWFLNNAGQLYVLSQRNYQVKRIFTFRSHITAIARDKTGNILTAEANGTITKIGSHFDTSILYKTDQNILYICLDSSNTVFLITQKGVYIPEDERLFYENAFTGPRSRIFTFGWSPSCFVLDPDQNIWLGFGAGEWGGEIIIFSTWYKRFTNLNEKLKRKCYIEPVRSLFLIDTIVHASTSLMHMGPPRSTLLTIKDTCSKIFESEAYSDISINKFNNNQIYIGPTIYNQSDNSIYFYCQFGVYKGNIKDDLSQFKNWKLLFDPNLLWRFGQPDAVGYSMNVKSMFFADDKLILISPDNGVMIWDGKSKILLR